MDTKELNFYIKPGTDVYKVKAYGDVEVEVVILKELDRGMVIVGALYGEPFDGSTAWGGAFMQKQATYWKGALQFSRKWE